MLHTHRLVTRLIIVTIVGAAALVPASGATHVGCSSPDAKTWDDIELPDTANPQATSTYYVYHDAADGSGGVGLYKETNHAHSFQPRTMDCLQQGSDGEMIILRDHPADVRIL